MSDDDLHEFDLSAWGAPPPPVDLADGVIARAREGTPALEVAEPTRMASRARQRLIGGLAVVALAVAAVLLIWLGPGRETAKIAETAAADGSSSGNDARKLVLPGAIATLDPGAEIVWHRSGDDLVVTQRAGNATWQVDGSHRLRLDTGAAGASVEATGASLRVEVPMNLMDKRVLAGSAITAAVVAFATVTVYEGHVKTTTPTRTVIVKPGVEVALIDDVPIVSFKSSGDVTTSVAGIGDSPGGYVEVLTNALAPNNHDLEHCAKRFLAPPKVLFDVAIDHNGVATLTPKHGAEVELGGCVANVITGVAQHNHIHDVTVQFGWDADSKWSISGPVAPSHKPTADETYALLRTRAREANECSQQHPAKGEVMMHLTFGSSGHLDVSVDSSPDAELGACLADVVRTIPFPAAWHDMNVSFPFVYSDVTPHTVACDAKALAEQGKQKLATNDNVGGLKALAESLDCVDDATLYPTAYMAACGAGDEKEAKRYFNLFTSTRQTQLLPICLRNGIDPRAAAVKDSAPACDAKALVDQARQELGINAHAQALADFEKSLGCKDDPAVYPSAYMAACGSENAARAKYWFSKLPAARQPALRQICMRSGIDPR